VPRESPTDDEEARRMRAAELHRAIDEAVAGERRPASPREFTDQEAREAGEEEAAREPSEEPPADRDDEQREGA
jgi:hypothetical protein